MAERMLALAARQPVGITVSYWFSMDAIAAWRRHPEHRQAQRRAHEWYASYRVRICRVEQAYDWARGENGATREDAEP